MVVLIVEDEPIIALNLAAVLEDAGHTVLGPVHVPAAALDLARRNPRPSVALLDINLDGQPTGIELARSMQRLGIPSVFVSAQHALAWANRDAVLGFIGKPYTSSGICECMEALEATLRGESQHNPHCALELFHSNVAATDPRSQSTCD